MAGELPDSNGLVREVESLRRRVRELEDELQGIKHAPAETEAKLRERDDDIRILMETIPDMVSRHRPDSTYVSVSPACTRLFGYLPGDLVGRKAYDFIHPEDVSMVMAAAQRALEAGGLEAGEYRHLTKNGAYVWVETTGRVITGSQMDGPKDIICVVRDITVRGQSEEALQESEERYRLLFDEAGVGVGYYTPEGVIVVFNKAAAQHMGGNPGDFVGKSLQDLFGERAGSVYQARIREVAQSGQSQTYEDAVSLPIGEMYFRLRYTAIRNVCGKVVGVQVLSSDITDRKQSEDALRESEERYRSLVANTMDAVLLTTPEGRILSANEAACRMLGYSEDELIRMGRSGFVDDTDPRLAPALQERARIGHFHGELTFIRRDGTRFPGEITSAVFTEWHGQQYTSTVIRDITERKRAEEALRESEERYRTVADFTYDWEYWLGPDQRFLYCSPACERITNYRSEEFEKDPDLFMGIIHPGDRDQIACDADDATSQGSESHEQEFRIITRAGEVRWIAHACRIVRGRDGAYLGRRASNRDITERKRAEAALRESERRYNDMVSKVELISVMLDRDARVTFCNDYLLRLTGWRHEEVFGSDWFELFIPPGSNELKRAFAALLNDTPATWHHENEILTRCGERRLIRWNNSVLCSTSGEVIGSASIGEDITEHKRAEKTLVAERDLAVALSRTMGLRETLRLCLDTAMDVSGMDCGGIYLVDTTSGSLDLAFAVGFSAPFVEMSSHYEEDSGTARLVMTGCPIYGRHQDLGLSLSTAELGEGLRALAIIPVQHDGRVIGCVNVASHVMDKVSESSRAALETIAGQVGSGIHRSQTDEALNAHKRQLQFLASELVQSEESERRRIAVYLHDQVGQSLSAVRMKFDVWKRMKMSSKRRMLLSNIEQLIDLAIEETRTLTFELSPPILFELGIGPALEWLGEDLCGKEGITFEFRDGGQSRRIEESLANALYRIARELLSNALKHAQARQISISVSADDNDFRMVLKDNGVGMDHSRYEKALRGVGGTYGLFSIRERLQHFSGSLEIESSPGEGTSATVVVPVSYSASLDDGDLA